MFSLIVTIIAIVLVALLAVATLYYGANNMSTAKARADAVASITQGQQIIGAAQVYRADTGAWPTSINDLVAGKYLNTTPAASFSASSSASAQVAQLLDASGLIDVAFAATNKPWETVQPVVPYYWLHRIVPQDVCQAVNKATRGDDGIYLAAKPSLAVQCFGPAGQYSVIVGLPVPAGTLSQSIGVADPALVVNESGSGWTVTPTVSGSNSSAPTAPATPTTPSTPAASVAYLSATTLAYGKVPIGIAAPAQAISVTNGGTSALSNIVIATTGAGFTGTSNCPVAPASLSAGASCSISIGFTPTSATAVNGTVTVNASGMTSSASASLTGEGFALPTAASLSVSSVPAAGGVLITVTGSNYTSTSTVQVGGTSVPTTYVSASQLQFTAPAGTPNSTTNITVVNPSYSANPSSSLSLAYQALPALTQMTGVASGGAVPWSTSAAVDQSGNIYSQDYNYSTGRYRILKNGAPLITDVIPTLTGASCSSGIQITRLWVAPTQDLYAVFRCDSDSHDGIIGYNRSTGAVISRATTSKLSLSGAGLAWPSYDGATIYFTDSNAANTYSVPYNVANGTAFNSGTNWVTRSPAIRSSFVGADGASYWVGPNSELQMAAVGSGWVGLGITVAAPYGGGSVAVDATGNNIYVSNSSGELYRANKATKVVEKIWTFPNNAGSTLSLGQDGKVYAAVLTQGVFRIN